MQFYNVNVTGKDCIHFATCIENEIAHVLVFNSIVNVNKQPMFILFAENLN